MTTDKEITPGKRRLSLAQKLKESREYIGMTINEVANVLRVPGTIVELIESGRRPIPQEELRKLSLIYGKSLSALITNKDIDLSSTSRFLAREKNGATQNDLNEIIRFAAYLQETNTKINRA